MATEYERFERLRRLAGAPADMIGELWLKFESVKGKPDPYIVTTFKNLITDQARKEQRELALFVDDSDPDSIASTDPAPLAIETQRPFQILPIFPIPNKNKRMELTRQYIEMALNLKKPTGKNAQIAMSELIRNSSKGYDMAGAIANNVKFYESIGALKMAVKPIFFHYLSIHRPEIAENWNAPSVSRFSYYRTAVNFCNHYNYAGFKKILDYTLEYRKLTKEPGEYFYIEAIQSAIAETESNHTTTTFEALQRATGAERVALYCHLLFAIYRGFVELDDIERNESTNLFFKNPKLNDPKYLI